MSLWDLREYDDPGAGSTAAGGLAWREGYPYEKKLSRRKYERSKRELQIELLKLQVWVKENYGAHAYPRRISFVEALPKTPSGKVQRSVLRNQLAHAQNPSE